MHVLCQGLAECPEQCVDFLKRLPWGKTQCKSQEVPGSRPNTRGQGARGGLGGRAEKTPGGKVRLSQARRGKVLEAGGCQERGGFPCEV